MKQRWYLLEDQSGALSVDAREGIVVDPKLGKQDLIFVRSKGGLEPLLRLDWGLSRVHNRPKGGIVEVVDVAYIRQQKMPEINQDSKR
jgi:hypothetical protein